MIDNIDTICNKIQNQGYFIYKNYSSNIKRLDYEFESIINNKSNIFDQNTGKNVCLRTKLNNKYLNKLIFPNIYNAFHNEFIIQICKKLGIDFLKDPKDVFIHKDYETLNTNNNYPHFDYDRKLKFYLCVNDMDKTNGCFKVLPNKLDIVNQIRDSGNKRNNIFNEKHKLYTGTHHIEISELTPLRAKAGDLIIFDTNCIHAGGDKFEGGKFRKVIRLHLNLSK